MYGEPKLGWLTKISWPAKITGTRTEVFCLSSFIQMVPNLPWFDLGVFHVMMVWKRSHSVETGLQILNLDLFPDSHNADNLPHSAGPNSCIPQLTSDHEGPQPLKSVVFTFHTPFNTWTGDVQYFIIHKLCMVVLPNRRLTHILHEYLQRRLGQAMIFGRWGIFNAFSSFNGFTSLWPCRMMRKICMLFHLIACKLIHHSLLDCIWEARIKALLSTKASLLT